MAAGALTVGSSLWTPAGNLLQLNTDLFFLVTMILQKGSSKKQNSWQSCTTGKMMLVSIRKGRMVQNYETVSYCRNHTVFLALSNVFFSTKRRTLWLSSSNLRFCMPCKDLIAAGFLGRTREEKLMCSTQAQRGEG